MYNLSIALWHDSLGALFTRWQDLGFIAITAHVSLLCLYNIRFHWLLAFHTSKTITMESLFFDCQKVWLIKLLLTLITLAQDFGFVASSTQMLHFVKIEHLVCESIVAVRAIQTLWMEHKIQSFDSVLQRFVVENGFAASKAVSSKVLSVNVLEVLVYLTYPKSVVGECHPDSQKVS
ncbi:hypothetical protein EDD86DRAFT_72120 [Gorgonomyces haynaldii]|nr:hypothetical protein EDD86DRAFT_72120 [Gorgonomyces haynaldii]